MSSEQSDNDADKEDSPKPVEHRKHRKRGGDYDSDNERHRRKHRENRERRPTSRKRHHDDEESSSEEERRKRRKKRKRREEKKKRKKKQRKRRSRDDSSADSRDDSDSSGESDSDGGDTKRRSTAENPKLLAKLQARGETLEERRQRRAARAEEKRAAFIATRFQYTSENNPFNDPNLHQAFTWKKKNDQQGTGKDTKSATTATKRPDESATATLEEIEKLRQRRKQRELQLEEMERIKREESRMKEMENFDDWARKEEDFHLQQQRQRSAIRLVQGREKPIDVLAKNMLLFGVDRENRAAVKYKERYNALDELGENLEVELEKPYQLLHMLKLHELEEVLADIEAFLTLEREAAVAAAGNLHENNNPILVYWQALKTVALDEVQFLKSGGEQGARAKTVEEVKKIFQHGQSTAALEEMKVQVAEKLSARSAEQQQEESFDRGYWETVAEQLDVHLAKSTLSEIHSQMLVRQLERLEQKRIELAKNPPEQASGQNNEPEPQQEEDGFGDVEEKDVEEVQVASKTRGSYSWADKYRPRKPRYFNRVKTGYDWNKYNKTHYDRDNPPPKTVQGYKFNIFYPDLIDPSKTPQFQLLKADSDEFCIIRFTAGPPYEDVAFLINNREWNKSRKHGFRSTFERGILSLYFNFKTSWYRR